MVWLALWASPRRTLALAAFYILPVAGLMGSSPKLQPFRLQCQQLWVARHTLPPGTCECAKNPGPTHTSWPGSLCCSTLQPLHSQLPHLHFIRVYPTPSAIPHQSTVMFLAVPPALGSDFPPLQRQTHADLPLLPAYFLCSTVLRSARKCIWGSAKLSEDLLCLRPDFLPSGFIT